MGAEADGEAVTVDGFLGLADGHDDPAPVGVFTGDGGLDQRAVGDRFGQLAGRGRTGGAVHRDLYEFGRSLAVADQLVGKVEHHAVEGTGEFLEPAVADPADARCPGSPGREQQAGVIGRGVPVDRYRVEGGPHMQAQHGAQHVRVNVGVRDDEGQHGRHVGRDHARALGNTGDADGVTVDLALGVRPLGEGVGGHDARSRSRPLVGSRRVGVEPGFDLAQTGGDFAVVEGDADHPG